MNTVPFESSRAGRCICDSGLKLSVPLMLGTEALIVIGAPNFSAPDVISSACKAKLVLSVFVIVDLATTYSVLLVGSITGVPKIPISASPLTPTQPWTFTGTVELPEGIKLTCHSGAWQFILSASKANMLSCSVATYTTL